MYTAHRNQLKKDINIPILGSNKLPVGEYTGELFLKYYPENIMAIFKTLAGQHKEYWKVEDRMLPWFRRIRAALFPDLECQMIIDNLPLEDFINILSGVRCKVFIHNYQPSTIEKVGGLYVGKVDNEEATKELNHPHLVDKYIPHIESFTYISDFEPLTNITEKFKGYVHSYTTSKIKSAPNRNHYKK